jgi:hypothetical protein
LAALPACSKHAKKQAAPPSTATTAVLPVIEVAVDGTRVESMHDPAPDLPDEVRDKVKATLAAYLRTAVAGQPGTALDALFTPAALARLAPGSPDRPVLLEDPLPPPGAVVPVASTASLTGLAGQNEEVGLVTASVNFVVKVGDVQVTRTGEVVLVPVGDAWQIDGFDLSAKRDTVPPTTLPPATNNTNKRKKK